MDFLWSMTPLARPAPRGRRPMGAPPSAPCRHKTPVDHRVTAGPAHRPESAVICRESNPQLPHPGPTCGPDTPPGLSRPSTTPHSSPIMYPETLKNASDYNQGIARVCLASRERARSEENADGRLVVGDFRMDNGPDRNVGLDLFLPE